MKTANNPPSNISRLLIFCFGILLALIGLALCLPGIKLVSLGGSFYYALAGALIVVSGVLIAMRRMAGAWLYGIIFLATVIWAFWEVWPSDSWFWPLVPRLVVPTVLASILLLLVPFFPAYRTGGAGKRVPFIGAVTLVLALVITLVSAFEPHGVIKNAYVPNADWKHSPETDEAGNEWRQYARTSMGTRYAPFKQITPENVSQLKVAWTFRYGDLPTGSAEDQNTPIFADNTVYTCSAHNIVHALDAVTGKTRWRFDPQAKSLMWERCRGLTYYEPSSPVALQQVNQVAHTSDAHCSARIVMNTIDGRLMQLDAKTGQPCKEFGQDGTVNLNAHLGKIDPGYYIPTSAPTVMENLIISGGWIWDGMRIGEPSGVIRAFDARTGELVWAWDMGNPGIDKLPPPGQTYTLGTPNVWSTPAYDAKLGLVYLPTGNATPDFWGGKRRPFDDRYSSAIVALDIKTGKERWHYQTVHHDLWDYDIPSQPALYDVPDGKGNSIPALIQLTKRGQIFMLDRRTGTPIAEVEERAVPVDPLPGDWMAPTQPYSVGMPQIGNTVLTEAKMWGTTPLDQLYCRIRFKELRYEGEFTPMSVKGTLVYPGSFGGMNWGSASIDESRGMLIVNDMRLARYVYMVPRDKAPKDFSLSSKTHGEGYFPQAGTPYGVTTGNLMSPLGVPCNQPPYGTISGIDLATRSVVWEVPAGTVQDTGPFGIKSGLKIPLGMPSLSGPMTTASGLAFYAGTQDFYLRAFGTTTGKLLWESRLPVGGQATPMSYIARDGKQYVVLSVGGARQSPERGDYIIAYALPDGVGQ